MTANLEMLRRNTTPGGVSSSGSMNRETASYKFTSSRAEEKIVEIGCSAWKVDVFLPKRPILHRSRIPLSLSIMPQTNWNHRSHAVLGNNGVQTVTIEKCVSHSHKHGFEEAMWPESS